MPDFEIHADYDGDGRISLSAREYALRSGGIRVTPNLDRDDRRLPTLSAASRPQAAGTRPPPPPAAYGQQPPAAYGVTPYVHLDWEPSTKTRADNELVPLVILRRAAATTPPPRVLLRYPASYGTALRVYDASRALLQPVSAGDSQQVAVGAFQSDRKELFVEVSRVGFGPGAPGDLIPLTLAVEVGGRLTEVDRTQVIIPPLVLSADTEPPSKMFIAEVPDLNTPTVREAEEFARAAGVPLVKVPLALNRGDVWLQDQLQFSYVRRERAAVPVVIHLPRVASGMTVDAAFDNIQVITPNLEGFVNEFFPSRDLGLYKDLYSTEFTYDTPAPGGRPRQGRLEMHDGYIAFLQLRQIVALRNNLEFVLHRLLNRQVPRDEGGLPDIITRQIPSLIARIRSERQRRGTAGSGDPIFAVFDRLLREYGRVRGRVVESAGESSYRITIERLGTPTQPATRQNVLVTLASADRLWEQVNAALNSLNYGGNIEVSPPTGAAGRRKLVVGVDSERPMGEALRQILWQSEPARHAPVTLLDTSWLEVGHVDEVMTFVPNRGRNPPFAILTASPGLAIDILTRAFELYSSAVTQQSGGGEWLSNQTYVAPPNAPGEPAPPTYTVSGVPYYNLPTSDGTTREGAHPVTRMFRGLRYERQRKVDYTWEYRVPQFFDTMMELLSANNLFLYQLRHTPYGPGDQRSHVYDYFHAALSHHRARMSVRSIIRIDGFVYLRQRERPDYGYNSTLQTESVNRVLEQLTESFPRTPFFDLPVLFDILPEKTTAFTPDLVNLQQLNEHMMVPRPYGPRMSAADSIAVIQDVVSRRNADSLPQPFTTRRLQRLIGREHLDVTIHWAHSFLDSTARDIADEFGDGFPPGTPAADIARRIMTANPGKFLAGGNLRPGWHRIRIPEQKVDLFELYTHALLDHLGLRVHWVDSWYYHTRLGGLHCGTNVLRRP
jgi:hypothetical protein